MIEADECLPRLFKRVESNELHYGWHIFKFNLKEADEDE